MKGQLNPKILGATIVGFALVAGAYTVSNFGEPRQTIQTATVQNAAPAPRVAIAVTDEDQNGIEDWRDEFITTKAIILDQATTTYTPPDTVTGQMGINFMENIIRSRGYGAFGSSDEEIIQNTVDSLAREVSQSLYDTPDITIMSDWSEEDVYNYANTVAATVYRHNIPDLDGELEILHNILTKGNEDRMVELQSLVEVYRNYRDDTLKIPVPSLLVKEHLDLINTYNAIFLDIEAMTKGLEDPALTLVHMKRYEDDATGLAYALQNMFFALDPYASLFTAEDPATLFAIFSPDYQI